MLMSIPGKKQDMRARKKKGEKAVGGLCYADAAGRGIILRQQPFS